MATTQHSIDVNVPVRTAYNQWTQFESFPQFMEGVEEVHQLDDKRLHWKAKVGGRIQEWDAEITEQIPDQKIAWRSVSGDVNGGVVTFNYLGPSETRMLLSIDYEPQGALETVGSALGFMSRDVKGDLERFKTFIESQGLETGGWRGTIQEHPELGSQS